MLKKTVKVRGLTHLEALDYDAEAGKLVEAILALPFEERTMDYPAFRELKHQLNHLETRMGIIWLPSGHIRKIVL